MGTAIWRRRWALMCALALLLCVPVVRPWLAMGTVDDTSYARSAQLLEQTGHIVYNGWAAPMLGWQLYWGALFIKLFGFSFDVLRMSTLLVAMVSAFLSQRSMVRSGLTEWNATLATLTLVISPLFVPLTFSFMTDIGGFFVLVVCFYACLRALQADSDGSACCWIAFAAISNAIGGTVRQTSWLGLLIMVPSTLWLMRKRRKVLGCGLLSILLGLLIVAGAMHWYKHQPRIFPEPIWRGPLTVNKVRNIVQIITRSLFDTVLFVLPLLLPFLPKLRWRNRNLWLGTLSGAVILSAIFFLIQRQPEAWLLPTLGPYLSEHGALTAFAVHGMRPLLLPDAVRLVLTMLAICGVSGMFFTLRRRAVIDTHAEGVMPWRSLCLLTAPFVAAYIALMMSRASVDMVFDRYLVPLLFVALLVMGRAYQERISRRLPRYTFVLLGLMAAFSLGATHDAFAFLRANLAAARLLEARGVPDTAIDAGWEFNSWTALQTSGYLLPFERGNSFPDWWPALTNAPCLPGYAESLPGFHPKYTLTSVPDGCGGQIGIPPVHYRQWLGRHDQTVYIVASDRPH